MVIPENYKKALEKFISDNGNRSVSVLAILKMDEVIDKWSVILAIDWITDGNRREIFSSFISALQQELGGEELNEIARIVYYSPTDHLMELFFEKFKEGQYIKEDARVNGNVIHEGYIIKLSRNDTDDMDTGTTTSNQ